MCSAVTHTGCGTEGGCFWWQEWVMLGWWCPFGRRATAGVTLKVAPKCWPVCGSIAGTNRLSLMAAMWETAVDFFLLLKIPKSNSSHECAASLHLLHSFIHLYFCMKLADIVHQVLQAQLEKNTLFFTPHIIDQSNLPCMFQLVCNLIQKL